MNDNNIYEILDKLVCEVINSVESENREKELS